MSYSISFIIAILLTSLSYYLGSLLIRSGILIWQALLIGTSVVTIGALTEAFGAPIWLIVLMPFPVGMILLYIFLKQRRSKWIYTYLTTLVLYTLIHVFVSYFFAFHSIIPAWKLS